MGHPAASWIGREERVQSRVAAGEVRGADAGAGEEFAGARMGAAAGDLISPCHRRVLEPLRVELRARELEPRRSDVGVAADGGSVPQRRDSGKRAGGVRRSWEGEHGELHGGQGGGREDGKGGDVRGRDWEGNEEEGGRGSRIDESGVDGGSRIVAERFVRVFPSRRRQTAWAAGATFGRLGSVN